MVLLQKKVTFGPGQPDPIFTLTHVQVVSIHIPTNVYTKWLPPGGSSSTFYNVYSHQDYIYIYMYTKGGE